MSLLARGLIVSCQARVDNPLHGPALMAAMARAGAEAGAVAIRANGPADVAAIMAAVALPVIGIEKVWGREVVITPTRVAAAGLAAAGAAVIALDATDRPRPEPLAGLVDYIRNELQRHVFADVSTLDEGLRAADLGADYVATTLAGHTAATACQAGPDIGLVEALAARLSVPVIAEGRYATPADVRAALGAGAHAVVIGTAITNPREIARGFVAAWE